MIKLMFQQDRSAADLRVNFRGCDGNQKIYSIAIRIIQVRNDGSMDKSYSIVDVKRLIYFKCATDRIC